MIMRSEEVQMKSGEWKSHAEHTFILISPDFLRQ